MEQLFLWVGVLVAVLAVASIVSTLVTMAIARRIEPNDKLQSALRALESDFSDLTDHINRRETRERVRKMRDGREAAANQMEAAAPGPMTDAERIAAHKRELRQRVRGVIGRTPSDVA